MRQTAPVASRGVSTIAIIGILVVVVAAVGAFLYFGSDVWRTRVQERYNQFAHWTPENIAKHPAEYLTFCEEQTKAATEKLKASEIAIAQKKARLEAMREDANNKLTVGQKAIEELKDNYRKCKEASAWPVAWRESKLEKEQAEKQIVKLDREIRSKEGLLKTFKSATDQLTVQQNKVIEAKDKANEQLAKIATNREMLKVQQITDDLKKTLVDMKAAIETSVMGVASSDTGSLVSLDDLAAKSETGVDEKEFEKIMAAK